jgi:hypothetical protein
MRRETITIDWDIVVVLAIALLSSSR